MKQTNSAVRGVVGAGRLQPVLGNRIGGVTRVQYAVAIVDYQQVRRIGRSASKGG